MVLGPHLYVDMCDPSSFEAKVDEIVSRVLGMVGESLQSLLDRQMASLMPAPKASFLSASAAASATDASRSMVPSTSGNILLPPDAEQEAVIRKLKSFFIDECQVFPAKFKICNYKSYIIKNNHH